MISEKDAKRMVEQCQAYVSLLETSFANFVFAYVLQGKFTKTKQAVSVSVSQDEFDKFTKAKQNKLLVEWELQAYKQFIKSLFNNSDVLEKSMPTDFVSCEFEGLEKADIDEDWSNTIV